jgi:NAD(P)-dependent dehydrogenase (short-subunit alcohol dehydrogenase family)
MPASKIALITGANKGIGYEAARQLIAKGFQVFVAARNRDLGMKAAATLGKSAVFVELDVADASSIRRAAKAVASQVSHLDILVNNAGIFEDDDKNVLAVSVDTILKTFQTNVLGALLVSQAFVSLLSKSEAACIINVSSGAGQLNDMESFAPAYSISKTALNAVTRQLAPVLRDKNIAVNSVCPGWCRTDMGGQNAPRTAEQGADTIVWLATDAPRDLTGKFFRDRTEIGW